MVWNWSCSNRESRSRYTKIEDDVNFATPRRSLFVTAFSISAALIAVTLFGGAGLQQNQFSSSLLISLTPSLGLASWKHSAITSAEMKLISLVASNEYTAVYGHPGKAYRWFKLGTLVEPYKTTTLELAGLPSRLSGHSFSCTAVHTGTGEAADEVSSVDSARSNTDVVNCLTQFKR